MSSGDAAHPQRHDDDTGGSELFDDRGWDVGGFDGDDDRVVGGAGLVAVFAVAVHDLDVRIAGPVQVRSGCAGDVGVDVKGDDMPLRAGELGDQGGVVAAGADLQDP